MNKLDGVNNIKQSIYELEKSLNDNRDVYLVNFEGKTNVLSREAHYEYVMLNAHGRVLNDSLDHFKPTSQVVIGSACAILKEATEFEDRSIYFGTSQMSKLAMLRMASVFAVFEMKKILKAEGY
ncbi:hypothetical protein [Mammaliicoccus sp. G-M28]|uniref:hypothetical protein n=1 Tax=Mammaliicoccus sp. G-M28 TaxID=2898688 RepID=UPI001EFB4E3E|nr:hypothetical protein [Mammaliicoccus sp. G-M28]